LLAEKYSFRRSYTIALLLFLLVQLPLSLQLHRPVVPVLPGMASSVRFLPMQSHGRRRRNATTAVSDVTPNNTMLGIIVPVRLPVRNDDDDDIGR
jgi:hypothetical protein